MKKITITSDDIIATETYKKLDKIQQKVIRKLKNVKSIEHNMNVIKNIGFEKWQKEFKTTYLNILIIKELSNEQ